jgi:hypothetical protein
MREFLVDQQFLRGRPKWQIARLGNFTGIYLGNYNSELGQTRRDYTELRSLQARTACMHGLRRFLIAVLETRHIVESVDSCYGRPYLHNDCFYHYESASYRSAWGRQPMSTSPKHIETENPWKCGKYKLFSKLDPQYLSDGQTDSAEILLVLSKNKRLSNCEIWKP